MNKNTLIHILIIAVNISIAAFFFDYKNREPDFRINLFLIIAMTVVVFAGLLVGYFAVKSIYKTIKRQFL